MPSRPDHLALALDFDDLVVALRVARPAPLVRCGQGRLRALQRGRPRAVSTMTNLGYAVFFDLKLHDIPTTVRPGGAVLGALGAPLPQPAHCRAATAMVRAGVEGFADGRPAAGLPEPWRSPSPCSPATDATPRLLPNGSRRRRAGCGGVVCAAPDLARGRARAAAARVVPGIRPAGVPVDDQAAPATPARGLAAGADLLVIGRAVTAAADPVAAADAECREVAERSHVRPLGPRARVPVMALPSLRHAGAASGRAGEGRRGPPARAELKERLKMGSRHPQGAVRARRGDEVVGKMKVLAVLESLPGVGKVKARRTMEEIGISETRRVRGLGEQQRRALLERLGLTPADRRRLRPRRSRQGHARRSPGRTRSRPCG